MNKENNPTITKCPLYILPKGGKRYKLLKSNVPCLFDFDISNIEVLPYGDNVALDVSSNQWFEVTEYKKDDSYPQEVFNSIKNNGDTESATIKDIFHHKKRKKTSPAHQIDAPRSIAWVNGDCIYFQNIYESKMIRRKLISISELDPAKIEDSPNRIVINDYPDYIYNRKLDKLYFQNLGKVRKVIKDIENLYKSLNNKELKEAIPREYIHFDNFDIENISIMNRRRINTSRELLSSLDKSRVDEVTEYINKYINDSIKVANDGKIIINSNDELKYLLYGIGERYYTASKFGVKCEKRIANSIIPI